MNAMAATKVICKAFSIPVGLGVLLLVFLLSNNSFKMAESEFNFEEDKHRTNKFSVCVSGSFSSSSSSEGSSKSVTLFVITPTFRRPEQIAELTRLAQTLEGVSGSVHWIVAEDEAECSDAVQSLLKRKDISFTLLASPMPREFRSPDRIRKFGLPRGVAGRRAALQWIVENTRSSDSSSVVYFADDDNAYDSRLFSEIRQTKLVSMFPVGLLRPSGVRSPLVGREDGKVRGFVGSKRPGRKFPVDMAGFAFTVRVLRGKRPVMPYRATFEEDGFIRAMGIEYSDIEPLASNCTEILVWHTMTSQATPKSFGFSPDGNSANVNDLLRNMFRFGLANPVLEGGNGLPFCIGSQCSNQLN